MDYTYVVKFITKHNWHQSEAGESNNSNLNLMYSGFKVGP